MTKKINEYNVTVSVCLNVLAESEDEAAALGEEWAGVCQGAPEAVSFVCADVQRADLNYTDLGDDEEEEED